MEVYRPMKPKMKGTIIQAPFQHGVELKKRFNNHKWGQYGMYI